jgi:hypothetical protein
MECDCLIENGIVVTYIVASIFLFVWMWLESE